ncbi:TlpA family protein disulfide reductase [bacterium]|nr:TlpA family protein disulfide reductase [bacterium]
MQTYRICQLMMTVTLAVLFGHSSAQAQNCRPKSGGSCSPQKTEMTDVKQVQPQIRLETSSNGACAKASESCASTGQSAGLSGDAGRVDLSASGNRCRTAMSTSRSVTLQAYFEEVLRGKQGSPAEFRLINIHGETLRFAKYTGKPFVVAFLCSHSRRNLPALSQLTNKYARDDLTLVPVGIFDGSQEDLRELHAFGKRSDLCEELLIHNDPAISTACRNSVVTAFLLVDRNGQLVKKIVGNQSLANLEVELDEMMRNTAYQTEISGSGAE